MPNKQHNFLSWIFFSTALPAVTITIILALTGSLTQTLQAQTYQRIYSFTGGSDGFGPRTGLAMDRAGNFYGTTDRGGSGGYGTVFKLRSTSSGWTLTTLYSFTGGQDGGYPQASLTVAPNGIIYGTTYLGGGTCPLPYGSIPCGLVFELRPSRNAVSTAWTETVIHTFTGSPSDGAGPASGTLVLDRAGNLYGTTIHGGANNDGTAYELTPASTIWMLNILYNGDAGAGVVADSVGNFYGANSQHILGTIYELSLVDRQWAMSDLYIFRGGPPDGPILPTSVMLGADGNLYGTTFFSHSGCTGSTGGSIFMLTRYGEYWSFAPLYDFGSSIPHGPEYPLIRGASGNLYGGYDIENLIYRLTPAPPGEYWGYAVLHQFSGSDGGTPVGSLILDAQGNLWGTAQDGGAYNQGVIWEITSPSEQTGPVPSPGPTRMIQPASETCP